MAGERYKFNNYELDPVERRLFSGGQQVELNSRYFDALLLLLQYPGTLISKERFLKEVWQGIPVTDEVLTQCIKTLRRQLGDSAARPHVIETIPKHGYRFIAAVSRSGEAEAALTDRTVVTDTRTIPDAISLDWRLCWLTLGAGITGGGVAGLLGGVAFGFIAVAQTPQSDIGALSTLLVLTALATFVGLIGAAGVVGGNAAARLVGSHFTFAGLVGGAAGGLLIGSFGKFIGHDTFLLLLGQAPGNITGPLEGLVLGAAVGLGDDLRRKYSASWSVRRNLLLITVIGTLAGLLITLGGGRLLGGSLVLLATNFPEARLHLDPLDILPGPFAAGLTNILEAAWFSLCVVTAMSLARR